MNWEELRKKYGLPTRTRRPPSNEEHLIQSACVRWFRLQYKQYLIWAVPNGGARNHVVAAQMKEEGQLPGVSDLVIVADHAILFVEMKTEKGKQSEYQIEFEKRITRLGFQYVVCRSFDDFKATVEHWLNEIQKRRNDATKEQ